MSAREERSGPEEPGVGRRVRAPTRRSRPALPDWSASWPRRWRARPRPPRSWASSAGRGPIRSRSSRPSSSAPSSCATPASVRSTCWTASSFVASRFTGRPRRSPSSCSGRRSRATRADSGAWARGEPHQVLDASEMPSYQNGHPLIRRWVDEHGLRTWLGVPLVDGDRYVGSIVIWRQEVRPFEQRQVDLVSTFAAQAVVAIENSRLFEELEQAQRRPRRGAGAADRHGRGAQAHQLRSPTDLDSVLRRSPRAPRGCADLHHGLIFQLRWRVHASGRPERWLARQRRILEENPARAGRDSVERPHHPRAANDPPLRILAERRLAVLSRVLRHDGPPDAYLASRCSADGELIGVFLAWRFERRPFTDSRDRAAGDVRRPGGDRHRERPPVPGAGAAQRRASGEQPPGLRGAGAADRHGRGAARSSPPRRPNLQQVLQAIVDSRGRPLRGRVYRDLSRRRRRISRDGVRWYHSARYARDFGRLRGAEGSELAGGSRRRGATNDRGGRRPHPGRLCVDGHPAARRLSDHARRADAPRGPAGRRHHRHADRRPPVHRAPDRTAGDLRRPGRDRDRERPPVRGLEQRNAS